MVRDRRLLLPSQGRLASIIAAEILDLVWPPQVPFTVVTVTGNGQAPDVSVIGDVMAERPVENRVVAGSDVVDAIVAEARLGYGAIVVGADQVSADGQLLSPLVDDLLARSPIPVVVVRRPRNTDRPLPWAFSRALVPIAGTSSSRAAQEVAFNLSARLGTEVSVLHVITRAAEERASSRLGSLVSTGAGLLERSHATTAQRLLDDATALGDRIGARTTTIVEADPSPARAICRAALDERADLVVLGASRRGVDGRPFLGHLVEEVVAGCDATIVVVATPPSHAHP